MNLSAVWDAFATWIGRIPDPERSKALPVAVLMVEATTRGHDIIEFHHTASVGLMWVSVIPDADKHRILRRICAAAYEERLHVRKVDE